MQFIGLRVIIKRIKAIKFMMADKNVPKRKKLLIILGVIYLFLPVDIIPPILFPFGFLDDLIIWLWILWHLKDTLDAYWVGEKEQDFSKAFNKENLVDGVDFTVEGETEKEQKGEEDGK